MLGEEMVTLEIETQVDFTHSNIIGHSAGSSVEDEEGDDSGGGESSGDEVRSSLALAPPRDKSWRAGNTNSSLFQSTNTPNSASTFANTFTDHSFPSSSASPLSLPYSLSHSNSHSQSVIPPRKTVATLPFFKSASPFSRSSNSISIDAYQNMEVAGGFSFHPEPNNSRRSSLVSFNPETSPPQSMSDPPAYMTAPTTPDGNPPPPRSTTPPAKNLSVLVGGFSSAPSPLQSPPPLPPSNKLATSVSSASFTSSSSSGSTTSSQDGPAPQSIKPSLNNSRTNFVAISKQHQHYSSPSAIVNSTVSVMPNTLNTPVAATTATTGSVDLRTQVATTLHKTLQLEYKLTLKEMESYEKQNATAAMECQRALLALHAAQVVVRERRRDLDLAVIERSGVDAIVRHLKERLDGLRKRMMWDNDNVTVGGGSGGYVGGGGGSLNRNGGVGGFFVEEDDGFFLSGGGNGGNSGGNFLTPSAMQQAFINSRRHSSPGYVFNSGSGGNVSSSNNSGFLAGGSTGNLGDDADFLGINNGVGSDDMKHFADEMKNSAIVEDYLLLGLAESEGSRVGDGGGGGIGGIGGDGPESIKDLDRAASLNATSISNGVATTSINILVGGGAGAIASGSSNSTEPSISKIKHSLQAVLDEQMHQHQQQFTFPSVSMARLHSAGPLTNKSASEMTFRRSSLGFHSSVGSNGSNGSVNNNSNNNVGNSGGGGGGGSGSVTVINGNPLSPSVDLSAMMSLGSSVACVAYQRGQCLGTGSEGCQAQHACSVILDVIASTDVFDVHLSTILFAFVPSGLWEGLSSVLLGIRRELVELWIADVYMNNLDNYLTEYIAKRRAEGLVDDDLLRLELQLTHSLPSSSTTVASAATAGTSSASASIATTPIPAQGLLLPPLPYSYGGHVYSSSQGSVMNLGMSQQQSSGLGMRGVDHPMHVAAAQAAMRVVSGGTNSGFISQHSQNAFGTGIVGGGSYDGKGKKHSISSVGSNNSVVYDGVSLLTESEKIFKLMGNNDWRIGLEMEREESDARRESDLEATEADELDSLHHFLPSNSDERDCDLESETSNDTTLPLLSNLVDEHDQNENQNYSLVAQHEMVFTQVPPAALNPRMDLEHESRVYLEGRVVEGFVAADGTLVFVVDANGRVVNNVSLQQIENFINNCNSNTEGGSIENINYAWPPVDRAAVSQLQRRYPRSFHMATLQMGNIGNAETTILQSLERNERDVDSQRLVSEIVDQVLQEVFSNNTIHSRSTTPEMSIFNRQQNFVGGSEDAIATPASSTTAITPGTISFRTFQDNMLELPNLTTFFRTFHSPTNIPSSPAFAFDPRINFVQFLRNGTNSNVGDFIAAIGLTGVNAWTPMNYASDIGIDERIDDRGDSGASGGIIETSTLAELATRPVAVVTRRVHDGRNNNDVDQSITIQTPLFEWLLTRNLLDVNGNIVQINEEFYRRYAVNDEIRLHHIRASANPELCGFDVPGSSNGGGLELVLLGLDSDGNERTGNVVVGIEENVTLRSREGVGNRESLEFERDEEVSCAVLAVSEMLFFSQSR
ncbi:hypothetical protein HK100_000492 [Physocladia obscura]|uniref:Uncharacterized protein n=1 Tax=Physocladia obscura TaxID=109957 RepID=A0AAD5TA88_9FUNG|nr:hypothetical protein HK100_000492 [Physocladia obscura]